MQYQKTDSEFIRQRNRALVLKTLRDHGPSSRTDLTAVTGLSPAAISGITGDLIEERRVREENSFGQGHQRHKGRGRPRIRLTLADNATVVLAIRIVGTTASLTLANYSGQPISNRQVQLQSKLAGERFWEGMIDAARGLIAQTVEGTDALGAISIAAQGAVDRVNGTINWSPVLAPRAIPVVSPLEMAFGVPVILSNDANMLAHAVRFQHKADYEGTFAVVMVDSGVGAGIYVDGRPFEGTTGAAAEFGHTNHEPDGPLCRCGRRGCLEAFVSDYGLWRMAKGDPRDAPAANDVNLDIASLRDAARAGDENAMRAFQMAGRALGFGLARLVALFAPSRLALTGTALQAWDLIGDPCKSGFEDALVEELREHVIIDVFKWDQDYVRDGAVLAALEHLDSQVFSRPILSPALQPNR